ERGDPGHQRGGVAGPAAQEVLVAGPGDRQALARRGQQDRVVAVRERRAGVVGVRRGDRDDAGIGRRGGVGGGAVPVDGAFLLALVADRGDHHDALADRVADGGALLGDLVV